MIKWFVYIVLLLILTPCLSFAHNKATFFYDSKLRILKIAVDTTKTAKQKLQEIDDKKRIKEVAKAKHQSKPEKLDESGTPPTQSNGKPKRQRRPAGLERPPEIPRRNGN